MTKVYSPVESQGSDGFRLLVTVAIVVTTLYFGAEIFVPIALAILLSFVLAPGVKFLQGLHLGRALPVVLMTFSAFLLIFALTGLMAMQVRDLAAQLPKYESTVRHKVESLRALAGTMKLDRATTLLSDMSGAIEDIGHAKNTSPEAAQGGGQDPMPVVVRQPNATPLETLKLLLTPLLHPLATTVIVVIFVLFILLQREDLRNRAIRLFGAGDLHRSTAAIDDAGRRLSRYLLSQLAVNTSAGLVVGFALWLVGVPSPVLWGIMFGCLRFVPYVGAPLAAILPIAVAAAVSPGWGVSLWTLGIYIVTEAVVGQVVEPFLYGHNTGLSPVAVVVAATFWTALWGPIGLILSTPLTVCLVVLGRHVEQLSFLDVLLGDRPPLSMPEVFYQRMLANDPVEAVDQAEQALKTMSLTDYHDKVTLPGLLLAQDDVSQGRLDSERQKQIAGTAIEVLEDLADAEGEGEDAGHHGRKGARTFIDRITRGGETEDDVEAGIHVDAAPDLPAEWRRPGAVLCLGGRGPLDDAVATALARILTQHGFGAEMASYETLTRAHIDELDLARARLVCLSCLDGDSAAFLRFLTRRLRRKAPNLAILIGAWWRSGAERPRTAADEAAGPAAPSTLNEALATCIRMAAGGTDAVAPHASVPALLAAS